VVAVLRAFAFNQSSAAKAGGVYRNCGGCAQRLIFGALAVDALTVAARDEQTANEQGHETNPPKH
jgi:hypothetical protein